MLFRSGGVVAFGDGFSVESGANLAVVIDGEDGAEAQDLAPVAGNEVSALLLDRQGTGV